MRILPASLSLPIGAIALLASACDRPATTTTTSSTAPPPPPAPSAAPSTSGTAPAPSTTTSAASDAAPPSDTIAVAFDTDSIGAPSPSFEGVVGDWYVAEDGGQRGLRVDGSKWRDGTPSVNLADQAKRLYGDRYAEFLDGVKAFAFFPLAIYQGAPPAGDMRISMRFYPEAGRIDQGAGIAFSIGADGTYQGVRANALEDNILYFKVVRGRRTVLENIRNTPTPTKHWHTLSVEFHGKQMAVELDGTKRLDKTLDSPPSGRIGLWSKADSQVLFDDFSAKKL
jgi:hypothetical protein